MHRFSNITGSARPVHILEKMTPSMGFGGQRQQQDMSALPPHPPPPQQQQQQQQQQPPGFKHAREPANFPRQNPSRYETSTLSFNIPFSSTLSGPEPDDVIHATPNARESWTHPTGSSEGTPVHQLPIHVQNFDNLAALCKRESDAAWEDFRPMSRAQNLDSQLVSRLVASRRLW